MSYLSNKSSFFFSLVAPVIYSAAYLGFKYFSFICFGGANISTWYEKRKESSILHIFSIHTSKTKSQQMNAPSQQKNYKLGLQYIQN